MQIQPIPLKIELLVEEPDWIMNKENFKIFDNIMAFITLSGMQKLGVELLKVLLHLHKKYPDWITRDEFRIWNKIIGTVYSK
jgi:hypothetical protein